VKYRRALFVAELGKDAAPHIAVLRRVAPQLEHLLVVAELPEPAFAWLFGERAPDDAATASLEALRAATAGAAPGVDVRLAPELGSEGLPALCVAEGIDLLVFASRTLRSAWMVSAERRHQSAAVLWSTGEPASGPIRELA